MSKNKEIDWLIGNKLTLRRVIIFKPLCERPAKRDIFTADIYYYMYIMTEFSYAKCDFCLAAYGGVVLQQFEFLTISYGDVVFLLCSKLSNVPLMIHYSYLQTENKLNIMIIKINNWS